MTPFCMRWGKPRRSESARCRYWDKQLRQPGRQQSLAALLRQVFPSGLDPVVPSGASPSKSSHRLQVTEPQAAATAKRGPESSMPALGASEPAAETPLPVTATARSTHDQRSAGPGMPRAVCGVAAAVNQQPLIHSLEPVVQISTGCKAPEQAPQQAAPAGRMQAATNDASGLKSAASLDAGEDPPAPAAVPLGADAAGVGALGGAASAADLDDTDSTPDRPPASLQQPNGKPAGAAACSRGHPKDMALDAQTTNTLVEAAGPHNEGLESAVTKSRPRLGRVLSAQAEQRRSVLVSQGSALRLLMQGAVYMHRTASPRWDASPRAGGTSRGPEGPQLGPRYRPASAPAMGAVGSSLSSGFGIAERLAAGIMKDAFLQEAWFDVSRGVKQCLLFPEMRVLGLHRCSVR